MMVTQDQHKTGDTLINKTIQKLFEQQVARNPSNTAITFKNQQLSYYELNEKANQVAHYLCTKGVGPETLVAIYMERGLSMIIGILGVLKAGGAYVPIDSSYPSQRVQYILNDSGAPFVLINNTSHTTLPSSLKPLLINLTDNAQITAFPKTNLQTLTQANNLAYVIYTSGSTGYPKGIMVEHRSLANLVYFQINKLRLTNHDRVLQFSSLSFDASVWEIFSTLVSGANLILDDINSMMPGKKLSRFIKEKRITVATLVPSVLRLTPPPINSHLRLLISAGEVLSEKVLQKWSEETQILNAYGLAETTVCATISETLHWSEAKNVGKPISNAFLEILDSKHHPCTHGQIGYVHIGGEVLARKYLNGEKIKDKNKLFNTGDLGYKTENNDLIIIGRKDNQIKINGIRISTEEVENYFIKLDAVKEVVVVPKTINEKKHLIAYITTYDKLEDVDIKMLKQEFKKYAPKYMLPSSIFLLKTLPRKPSEKVARNELDEIITATA